MYLKLARQLWLGFFFHFGLGSKFQETPVRICLNKWSYFDVLLHILAGLVLPLIATSFFYFSASFLDHNRNQTSRFLMPWRRHRHCNIFTMKTSQVGLHQVLIFKITAVAINTAVKIQNNSIYDFRKLKHCLAWKKVKFTLWWQRSPNFNIFLRSEQEVINKNSFV